MTRHSLSFTGLAFTLALAVGGGSSCTPAWKIAYERAEKARLAGDDVEAAAQYRASCGLDAPPESKACERADAFAGKAAERAITRSEGACRAGDVNVCLTAMLEVRSVLTSDAPELPRVQQLIDAAGDAHVKRCSEGGALATIEDAVVRFRCVSLRQADFALPQHNERVAAARRAVGAFLLEQAQRLQKKNAYGAASTHATLASCVAGGGEAKTTANDTRAQFIAANAVPVAMNVGGLSRGAVDGLCSALWDKSAMKCARGSERPALAADGTLRVGNLKHTQNRFEKTVEYIAGYDTVRNEEYYRLSDEIERDKRAMRNLEADARVGKADCDTAESALSRAGYCYNCPERTHQEATCNRAKALTDTYNNAVNDVNAKVTRLNGMSQTLQIERRATHSYVETLHRWELPWELSLADAPGLRDAVVVEGVDRPSFRPANIEGSVAREPDTRPLVVDIENKSSARIVQSLIDRLAARGRSEGALCDREKDEAARTDCELRALWYGGNEPVTAWLSQLSSKVDRNARYPAAACVAGN